MNIYVGNLAASTTSQQLREVFSKFGTVGRISLDDRVRDANSLCFCFVDMPQVEEAELAIRELNGQVVAGNALVIKASGVTA